MKKGEASKLQSDIILKLVVNVGDNKNGCSGVRSEAHQPLLQLTGANNRCLRKTIKNKKKGKHPVKVLQNNNF